MAIASKAGLIKACVAGIITSLIACSNQIVGPETGGVSVDGKVGGTEPTSRSEALTQLIAQARQAYEADDHQHALDLAERGLRIDRYAPELYLILAQGYYGLGLREQSVSFARLGLRYVGSRLDIKPELQALAGAD